MKEFLNKHLTAIAAVVITIVLVIVSVIALTMDSNTSTTDTENPSETSSVTEKDTVSESDSATEEPSETEEPTVEPTETETESEVTTEEPTESESETEAETTTESESETAPHAHSYKETVTAATCTKDGKKTFACDCGDVYTETIKATGHKYGAYKYNNDATTSKDGTKTATCSNCGAKDTVTAEGTKLSYTYTELNKTMWAKSSVNVRNLPSTEGDKLGKLAEGEAVTVTGKCNETGWYRIDYDGEVGYVSSSYLTDTEPEDDELNTSEERLKAGVYKVNGYEIRYEEDGVYKIKFELDKAMANAGVDNIIYYAPYNNYYMLIETPGDGIEEKMNISKRSREIEAYVRERGGSISGSSGNYSDIWIPGADEALYMLCVSLNE